MTNLRYLEISGDKFRSMQNLYLPNGLEWLSDKLRYLKWDKFPLESLPSTFCAKMLVELHMKESKLKKLWDGVQNLVNLKQIDISYSEDLNEMPDLSRATNLEILNLGYCSSMYELHPSVLSLPKLEELILPGWTKIKSLGNIHSKSLHVLDLQGCSSLMEFSVISEEMTFLALSWTAIHELPSFIWRNRKLEYLYLKGCEKLSIVGKKSSNDPGIVSLTVLDLSGCTQMDALNISFLLDGIQSLKRLYLNHCCNLETLPHNIHKHTELDKLVLDGCINLVLSSPTELLLPSLTCLSLGGTAIRELPSSIWRSKLKELHLSGCKELSIVGRKLSNDPGIDLYSKTLDLSRCTKIDALNVSFLLDGIQSLEELNLTDCWNLKTLPHNIHKHTELTRLSLGGTAIRELPSSIWRNSNLYDLDLSGCEELSIVGKKLSNDPGIEYLFHLDLSGCTQMDALNLSFLLDGIQSLKRLYLKNCCNLETLPHNIHKHTELDTLWLDDCINLVLSSPTELLPPSLKVLIATYCIIMDTDSIQRLLLDNMLQSILFDQWERIYGEYYLLLVQGEQVPDRFSFQGVNSITIPHISNSNLKGILLCVLVSKFTHLRDLRCYICEHGEVVGEINQFEGIDFETLIYDHVLVWGDNYWLSEGDHFNIEFKFQYLGEKEWVTDGIKGCGVLPIRRVEIVELESEASDVELESQACDVDEFDDQQQPPKKKMRA